MENKSRKERPLTVFNVLVVSVDLLFNFRGLGWAWHLSLSMEISTQYGQSITSFSNS